MSIGPIKPQGTIPPTLSPTQTGLLHGAHGAARDFVQAVDGGHLIAPASQTIGGVFGVDQSGGKMVIIADQMSKARVNFGTSGIRAHESLLTDSLCYSFGVACVELNRKLGYEFSEFAVAGDLRDSTDRIAKAFAAGIASTGVKVVWLGNIPTPAVALYGFTHKIPSAMVTASHNPGDNNGIKPNLPDMELLKSHEPLIKGLEVQIPKGIFNEDGSFISPYQFQLPDVNPKGREQYISRYLGMFPNEMLKGKRVGVYQHTSVSRDIMVEIYRRLGAEVVEIGRSDEFIEIDTEAVPENVKQMALGWAQEYNLDFIATADPDGDRPLLAGNDGVWLEGDKLDVLAAKAYNAGFAVATISCNSVLELSGFQTARSQIGSPYVVVAMNQAVKDGHQRVVGYERNGGFLTGGAITSDPVTTALSTRDAVLPMLLAMRLSIDKGKSLAQLQADLPQRFTYSDKITLPLTVPEVKGIAAGLNDKAKLEALFPELGGVKLIDTTDGVRVTFMNGEILHFRGSGNAPDLRVYVEASTQQRAQELATIAKEVLKSLGK